MIRMTGYTVAFLPAAANAASRRRGGLVRNSTEPGGPWVSLEAPRRQRSPGSERLIRRTRLLAMRTFCHIGGGGRSNLCRVRRKHQPQGRLEVSGGRQLTQ